MSFLDLARSIEHFVYDRVCALSELAPPDRGGATGPDALASPFDRPHEDARPHRG